MRIILLPRELRVVLVFILSFSLMGCETLQVVHIPIPIPSFGKSKKQKIDPTIATAQVSDKQQSIERIPPTERILYGSASWYGKECHGTAAASGERFDMNDLTAAHRTLPFDSKIKVTNLDNGKTCVLRVIDRGPFVDGRIIDVSYEAAKQLGFLQQGVAQVRIEVL